MKSQFLDFIETAHRDRVYPLIYCHMELDGLLDTARFTEAVGLSGRYIPEILHGYDFKRAAFIDRGLTADCTVISGSHDLGRGWKWDLGAGPQLKAGIIEEMGKSSVRIGISHILCDGVGFLHYLYLLAALYNGETVPLGLVNVRDIAPALDKFQAGPPSQQERNGKRAGAGCLALGGRGAVYQCLTETLDADSLAAVQVKAKQLGATLNDVFLTAYARVIAREWNTDRVFLPCPADLRRFMSAPDALTVANMTGMYRVAVELQNGYSFTELLQQVHIEMTLQKARRRCFSGISFLHSLSSKIPAPLLEALCKKYHHILPISYTNLGVIDEEQLHFQGSRIENCFLSGAYRRPPDYQLSVSTFQGRCTLSSSMIGSVERMNKGRDILEQVKGELAGFKLL